MSDQAARPVIAPGMFHTTHCCHVGDADVELILDTGFFRPECMTYAPHMHIEWELQIPHTGSYVVEISETGEAYRLSREMLLLLPPGCYHNTVTPAAHGDASASSTPEKFALRFTVTRSSSAEESVYRKLHGILSDQKAPIVLSCPAAAALLADVRQEITTEMPGHLSMAQALLCRFFILFMRALTEEADKRMGTAAITPRNSPAVVQNSTLSKQAAVVKILDRCYNTPLTEAAVAEMLGISVRGVSRLFADTFGMSFKQTLTQIRMRHAENLIVRTDIPIEQIALRIGYESPSAFYAVFRRTYGMPPGVYRKSKKLQITKDLSPDLGQNPTKDGALKH